MAARPRAHNLNVPNLYQKFDKRNGKAYYQYRDTRTGRFHGLGTDRTTAIKVATELNRLIAGQLVEQYHRIFNANPSNKQRNSPTPHLNLYMTLADIIGMFRKTDIVHNATRLHSTKPGDKV